MNLLPLFLVSLAAVGYETALTRYFAVAKWSEYGYWVISNVLAGFAFSGVAMALARDVFGHAPEAWWLTIPAIHLGFGTDYSPEADAGFHTAVAEIKRLAATFCA